MTTEALPSLEPESAQPAVIVDRRGSTMTITLNRPHALNAQNQELRIGLVEAIEEYEEDDSLLAAVIVGAGGRAFSAGADIKEMRAAPTDVRPGTTLPIARRPNFVHFEAVRHAEKPLIAAIDGHAVGGGLELALYCDVRVCTQHSTFGLPEPRTVGSTAGPGLHLLSRSIPFGEAMLMHLTSRPISAQRAYEVGLVQGVHADRAAMLDAANVIADQIAECSVEAIRTIKRVVQTAREMTVEQSEAVQLAITQTSYRTERAVNRR
jgi:enoyl-CoA hydratase/carnithine racemase